MPRFHFEVRGSEFFPDPQGVWLRNIAAARREAERLSTALVRDYPEVFAKSQHWEICILNENGHALEVQTFTPAPRPSANDD